MNHPHSTITCLVNAVYVSDTSQGLTVLELETIVTFLIRRTRHRPFRQCHIHPVFIPISTQTAILTDDWIGSGDILHGWSDGEDHASFVGPVRVDFAILALLELQ